MPIYFQLIEFSCYNFSGCGENQYLHQVFNDSALCSAIHDHISRIYTEQIDRRCLQGLVVDMGYTSSDMYVIEVYKMNIYV